MQLTFSDCVPTVTLPYTKFLQDILIELIQVFSNVPCALLGIPLALFSTVSLVNHSFKTYLSTSQMHDTVLGTG